MRRSFTYIALVFASGALGVGCSSSHATSSDGGAPEAGPTDSGTPDSAEAEASCVDGGTGTWDMQPARLDGNNNGATGPHVGFDAAGNAIAVWEQPDGMGIYSVWSSRRTPDGAWSAPQQISTTPMTGGGGTTMSPQIAVSANGSAFAVWQQAAGIGYQNVWANRYVPGMGWTGEATIQAPASMGGTQNFSSNPSVAVDSKGNAVVAWEQNDGQIDNGTPAPDFGTEVYANRYGGSWSGAVRLSAFGVDFMGANTATQGSGNAHAALDDAGDAIVIWNVTVANTGGKVQAARFDPGAGNWSAPSYVDACTSGCANMAIHPQAAFDGNRNAFAVYDLNSLGAASGVWAAQYTQSTGAWSMPVALAAGMTGGQFDHPRLAVSSAGNAVAVFTMSNQSKIIFGNVYQGGAWKGVAGLDDGMNTDTSGRPTVAMDGAGNATVLWDDQGAVLVSTLPVGSTSFAPQGTLAAAPGGYNDPDLAFSYGGCTRAVAVFWGGGAWAMVQH